MQQRGGVEDGGIKGPAGGAAGGLSRRRRQGEPCSHPIFIAEHSTKVEAEDATLPAQGQFHAQFSPLHFTAYSLQSAGNRGYVLQLCNAIRLQADTMPPTEFLRTYLNSHEQWRNFLGDLREATLQQQTPGLGFEVRAATFLQIFSPTLCPAYQQACTFCVRTDASLIDFPSAERKGNSHIVSFGDVRCLSFLDISPTGPSILEINSPLRMAESTMGEDI